MNDPTYVHEDINRDPVWKEAFRLSEEGNDLAPLGWSQYIPAARKILALRERVGRLETVLRKLHKDNEEEWEHSIDSKDIEALFQCPQCLDTGIVGERAEDGAPLACTYKGCEGGAR